MSYIYSTKIVIPTIIQAYIDDVRVFVHRVRVFEDDVRVVNKDVNIRVYEMYTLALKFSGNTYSKSGHSVLEHRSPFPPPQLFAHLHLWEKCVLKKCKCALKD